MRQIEHFWESVKSEETMILATSTGSSVTMRTVSPVYYKHEILIFTPFDSLKYQQLKENLNCCVAIGGCFAEAKAQFLGNTMLGENTKYRDAYSVKFKDAFSENTEFGGRNAAFILLKPTKVRGWSSKNGSSLSPFELQV